MSISMLVDPAAVRKALDLAGEDLRDRKVLGEIMVCSGSVFLLRYRWSDDGNRIDVDISLDGRNGPVRQACERMGQSVRLVDGWLERCLPRLFDDGVSRVGGFPAGMYPSWEKPGLRVLAAPPHLLIATVFLAALRPMGDMTVEDIEPTIRIAAVAGIRTGKRLSEVVAPYLKSKPNNDSNADHEVGRGLGLFERALERFGLGPPLQDCPMSLADVVERVSGNPDWLGYVMYEFEAAFYREESSAMQQAMLNPAPVATGDQRTDAWIGAVGEHMAQRWGLEVPQWTQEQIFMGGKEPHFWSDDPTARHIQIVETPPAFRRRLIFTSAEPLMSAKFPNHMKPRMPFWL
jgi:hypothetical protein